MIRTIIVDDEKMKSDALAGLLSTHFPEVEVLKVCRTVAEGVNQIKILQPELIFLDVKLDRPYTGFDLLEQTKEIKYKVIFTTAHNEYAVRAFEFAAIHYILTPCSYEDLNIAISRYRSLLDDDSEKSKAILLHNERHSSDASLQIIAIAVRKGLDFINVSDIIYCKSISNYTEFYLIGHRKITATKTLKSVEKQLKERDHRFERSHDSYLINLNHVKKYRIASGDIEGGEGGIVELTDEMEVPVSRRRKENFLKSLSK